MRTILKKYILFLLLLTFIIFPQSAVANDKISFIYLFGGTTEDYINQYEKTNDSIDIVSPNFFELDAQGNLIEKVDEDLVKYMHQQNVKIVPYLSNHWDQNSGQIALQNSNKLASDIAAAVVNYNLDGVNIDLENLTYEDRFNLTNFAALLKSKLPKEKTVSIAVGAVDMPMSSGWKSAYDLQGLSKVTDFLIVMAYDEHWQTSSPGPVASLPWVIDNLEYMLTQIPKDKLVLGVPFYGRVWTNAANGGGIWHDDIIQAAAKYGGTIKFHEEYQVPYVKYTKPDGNTKEIWFENYKSIQEKVRLVGKYDLKGVSAWRLGQEDTSIWKDFSSWYKEPYFKDISNHWAENDITYLTSQGLLSGKQTFYFVPDQGISRAETAAVLSRIFPWSISYSNPFLDISDSFWAKNPILMAYNETIMRGISTNMFGPEYKLTRAQLAVILQRAFGLEGNENSANSFQDVPANHWAAKEINILQNQGYIAGRTPNSFEPESYVTRAEFAVMVSRMLN